ncbi:MAG: helix-turn-helix transcriptional regulator [Candidatus Eremiobacteraeota bacterium]|nr:helix-turn-helix transcriptional regulator [Candidatus Eremiobacteraeota bacterium]
MAPGRTQKGTFKKEDKRRTLAGITRRTGLMKRGALEAYEEKWRDDCDYRIEVLKIKVTEQICSLMKDKSISRAELARRLGSSRAYITKLLNGSANLTLETLVKIASSLDSELEILLLPEAQGPGKEKAA